MPKKKGVKILGWTLSISVISFALVYFWLKAIGNVMDDWFLSNNTIILIITSVLLIFAIVFGLIKLSSFKKIKRMF